MLEYSIGIIGILFNWYCWNTLQLVLLEYSDTLIGSIGILWLVVLEYSNCERFFWQTLHAMAWQDSAHSNWWTSRCDHPRFSNPSNVPEQFQFSQLHDQNVHASASFQSVPTPVSIYGNTLDRHQMNTQHQGMGAAFNSNNDQQVTFHFLLILSKIGIF